MRQATTLASCTRWRRATLTAVGVVVVGTLTMAQSRRIDEAEDRPQVIGPGAATGTRASQAATGGSIRGRVVDANGAPVRGATVSAFAVPAPSTAAPTRAEPAASTRPGNVTYEVVTEPDGTYALTGLPSATLRLSAHRDGYFPAAPPGGRASLSRQQMLTVSEGAMVTAPDLLLVRGGAIVGRVVDAHGEPVVRAQVVPMRRTGDRTQPFRMAGSMDMTDDRGQYRLHGLPAGRYTVHVSPTGFRGSPAGVIQGDVSEPLRAFAPGTTAFAAAEFVEVSHAADVGLDIRLPRGRPATIGGRVFADGPEPLGEVAISLRPLDARVDIPLGFARTSGPAPFVVTGLPPGQYQLVAEETVVSRARVSPVHIGRAGRVEVTVDDADVVDIAVHIGPGTTLEGRVEIEGSTADALASRPLLIQSSRAPTAPLGTSVRADVAPDLAFTLRGLHGRQRLHVARLPVDWWVKSITIGGRDVSAGHDYPRSGTIEDCVIVVSARPTGLTGTVESGPPLPGGTVLVVIPEQDDPFSHLAGSSMLILAVEADRRFTLRGVQPGRYVVAALTPDVLDAVNDAPPDEHTEFLRSVGTAVDVVEGRLESVSLRLVHQTP